MPETAAKSRAKLYAIAIPLAALAIAGALGVAFSPWLLVHQPLLLAAMSPLIRHLVLISPTVDAVPFFVISIARLFAPDPFMYALGYRYGARAVQWVESRSPFVGRWVRFVERLFDKAGVVVVFLWPGVTACTLAGVARMPIPIFVAANIAGTAAIVSLVRYVGGEFREWILWLLQIVEDNVAEFTVGFLVLSILGLAVWRRRVRATVVGVQELESETDG